MIAFGAYGIIGDEKQTAFYPRFADDPELCEAYWHYRQMSYAHEAELTEANARGDLLHENHPLIQARYRVQDLMDQRRADGRWPNRSLRRLATVEADHSR